MTITILSVPHALPLTRLPRLMLICGNRRFFVEFWPKKYCGKRSLNAVFLWAARVTTYTANSEQATAWNQAPTGRALNPTVRELVHEWIQQHTFQIGNTCDALLSYTAPGMVANRAGLIRYIQADLIPAIDQAAGDTMLPDQSRASALRTAEFCQCSVFPLAYASFITTSPRLDRGPRKTRLIVISTSLFASSPHRLRR